MSDCAISCRGGSHGIWRGINWLYCIYLDLINKITKVIYLIPQTVWHNNNIQYCDKFAKRVQPEKDNGNRVRLQLLSYSQGGGMLMGRFSAPDQIKCKCILVGCASFN